MDLFASFKQSLKKSVSALKGKDDPTAALFKAVEASDNWEGLEKRLVELRAVSRKRQQEVLDRLEPLAKRVEGILAQAKDAKIKVMKQNLLRQAEGFVQELEAEDEPAKIHGANCQMLTNIIKQVRRARAMAERGVEAQAIDTITTRLEEIVVSHESAMEAATELDQAGEISTPVSTTASSLEKRLSAVYDLGDDDVQEEPAAADSDEQTKALEKKLYE
ncbi:MAG: hypothetical protein NTW86_11925 [Candidatus Sumerlaeota bacterium]|nr:hypothetical protein [Candidatus Sumerlaeota bacterium]